MSPVLNDILSANGSIARRLGSLYEFRPQQLEMASAVEDAIARGQSLLVEAGTGVGKSFAYLLPAIDYAVKKKKRVVISTHTISLQEQLIEKDIPLIQSVYPDEFTAVLVKGRGNYLCQRRLEQARGRALGLFETARQRESLRAVEQWAEKTSAGSLADFPGVPEPGVWDQVRAEHGNCLNKQCKFYEKCFWQAAKRRMKSGNILVVNHALFFSDLALRIAGINYLPKYDVAILDEAHTLEDVAGEHFGLKVSQFAARYQLRVLYDPRRGKGLLNSHAAIAGSAIDKVLELHPLAEEFFAACDEWQRDHGRANGRVHEPNIVENHFSPALRELAGRITAMLTALEKPEDISEISAAAAKVGMLADQVDAFVTQKMKDAVYWIERNPRGPNISLHAAPIDIAAGLREHLFKKVQSVTMCSATLCTGENSFSYIAQRLGADQARTLSLGSPFDYEKQVTLYIEADLPEPGDTRYFMPAACEKIEQYLQQTNGGAFVLFTSYSALKDAATRLTERLADLGLPLLIQGAEAPRRVLLERFRQTPNAVLFGTSSFWQGIDVRGDALRNVIIVKLPFAVPDEPIIEARLEMITRAGGNPFMEYSVPEAIIKLKQGFGRLIRSKTDHGIVVILDSRVKSKRYGKLFLDALPQCNVVVSQKSDE